MIDQVCQADHRWKQGTVYSKPVLYWQERDKLTREVMRLMLFRQKSQPDVPVPRSELTKVILVSYKECNNSNLVNLAVALAQDAFCKVMGMELKELVIAPVSKGKINKLTGVSCSGLSQQQCSTQKLRFCCTSTCQCVYLCEHRAYLTATMQHSETLLSLHVNLSMCMSV